MKALKFAVAVFCLSLLSSAMAATVYDPASGFSTNSNPNGVWTYGYSTTLGGTIHLYEERGTDVGLTLWRTNMLYGAPGVYYNPTDATITPNTARLGPKQLTFHPGPNGEYSIIRFTVPASGQYQLVTSFVGADLGNTTTDVHVLTNGVAVFNGTVFGYGPGSGPSYSNTFSLQTGQTLDFAVGRGYNDFGRDTTGISAQISGNVPAPTLTCPAAATIECETAAEVVVTAGSPNGSAMNVVWTVNGAPLQTNAIAGGNGPTSAQVSFVSILPIGTNLVQVSATDSAAQTASCSANITVQDTTPPTFFSAAAQPAVLSPPNHKMVSVNLSATLGENCSLFSWRIIDVSCSEPVRSADWVITGDHTLQLRAERAGKTKARTYSITLEAIDSFQNTSRRVVNVIVP